MAFLRKNADCFTFSMSEMPRLPECQACHKLDIINGSKPVKQQQHKLNPKIRRFEYADIIKRIKFLD